MKTYRFGSAFGSAGRPNRGPRELRFSRLLRELGGKTPSPSHASAQSRRPLGRDGTAYTAGRPVATSGTLTPAPRCSRGQGSARTRRAELPWRRLLPAAQTAGVQTGESRRGVRVGQRGRGRGVGPPFAGVGVPKPRRGATGRGWDGGGRLETRGAQGPCQRPPRPACEGRPTAGHFTPQVSARRCSGEGRASALPAARARRAGGAGFRGGIPRSWSLSALLLGSIFRYCQGRHPRLGEPASLAPLTLSPHPMLNREREEQHGTSRLLQA